MCSFEDAIFTAMAFFPNAARRRFDAARIG